MTTFFYVKDVPEALVPVPEALVPVPEALVNKKWSPVKNKPLTKIFYDDVLNFGVCWIIPVIREKIFDVLVNCGLGLSDV